MHHSPLLKKTSALLLILLLLSCTIMLSACNGGQPPAETTGIEASGYPETTEGNEVPATVSVTVTLPSPEVTLSDFPVLVTLDSSHRVLFEADADRLTVTAEDGIPLAYETVFFSETELSAELWVLLPEYKADSDTVLTVSAGGFGSAGSVWANGYDLVLHMNSIEAGDSSPNNRKVSAFGTIEPTDGATTLGNALSFNGSDAYLTVADAFPLLPEEAMTPVNNAYQSTGYIKPTDWNHAQGLTTDGEYLYFAGHFDSIGKGASIHKIRMSDMQEVAIFDHVAPMHGADMDYHTERGTLFVSSGGNHPAMIYEIDKETGEVLDRWDLRVEGYGIGAAVTLLGDLDIIMTTGTDNGAKIAFSHITLEEGGNYTVLNQWHYDETDLGVPQGIETLSSRTDEAFTLYYLADAGSDVSVDPHYLYAIDLTPGEDPAITARYHISIKEETEGISFLTREDGRTDVYFGSNAERIYRLEDPLEALKETPFDSSDSPNAFTLSFFVKVNETESQYPGILGFGSETNNKNRFSLHLFGDTDGKLRFGTCLDDVWTKLDTGAGALTRGKYHHVAAVYDGSEMLLYIDGAPVSSKAVSGLLTDYGSPFSIGADIENGVPAFHFCGDIDEVRLVRGVRSPEWIAAEAAQK